LRYLNSGTTRSGERIEQFAPLAQAKRRSASIETFPLIG